MGQGLDLRLLQTQPIEVECYGRVDQNPPALTTSPFFAEVKKQRDNWKRSSLYFHVPKTLKLVGGSAYAGQPDKVTTTMDAHAPETKKLFARMKSMQETYFKRLKDFKVLLNSFRHGKNMADKLETIKMSFDVAAMLVQ